MLLAAAAGAVGVYCRLLRPYRFLEVNRATCTVAEVRGHRFSSRRQTWWFSDVSDVDVIHVTYKDPDDAPDRPCHGWFTPCLKLKSGMTVRFGEKTDKRENAQQIADAMRKAVGLP